MKITVAGGGYVGLSLATLLSQKNEVVVLEIHQDKADKISNLESPIRDEYIEKFFDEASGVSVNSTFAVALTTRRPWKAPSL